MVEPIGGLYFSQPDADYPEQPTLVCTDHETERARYWLACVDHPSVRTTWTRRISCAADLEIEAGGVRREEEVSVPPSGSASPSSAALRTAARVAGSLSGMFESVDGIELAAMAGTNITEDDLRRGLGDIPQMMRWAQRRLQTDFPYPKYFQFAAWASAARWRTSPSRLGRPTHRRPRTRSGVGPLIKRVNLHELAHSWPGDAVVCRDHAHAWLKESWATYLETCWLEDEVGADGLLCALRTRGALLLRGPQPLHPGHQTKNYVGSWDLYDAHLYPVGRGACTCCVIASRGSFWAGVRQYLATCRDTRSRRTSSGGSWRSSAERPEPSSISGSSPGHPRLSVSFPEPRRRGGHFRDQADAGEQGAWRGPLPAPLTLARSSAGAGTEPRSTSTVRDMSCGWRWRRIQTPSAWIRTRSCWRGGADAGAPRWRRMLRPDHDLVGRSAGRALAKLGGRTNLDALRQAYGTEPFWGSGSPGQGSCRLGTAGGSGLPAAWLETEEVPRSR